MKGCLQPFAALAAVVLLMFFGGTREPESTFGSTADVQLEAEQPAAVVHEIARVESPLVVGPPPESLIVLTSGGELFVEPKFTEPAKPVPVAVKKAAPAGHWEYRQSCGRGGCSMQQVLVADTAPVAQQQSYGSCGPGGCGVARRGWFGRRR